MGVSHLQNTNWFNTFIYLIPDLSQIIFTYMIYLSFMEILLETWGSGELWSPMSVPLILLYRW